ncbi:glycoside hydrolase family 5 protein [Acidicapsa acidisoli]|uniref:glycoside hydrolase family 5 protein n=1 Tax=Acidicapsa acidisoli TaxID=1615681 RepID=UPI0021DFA992|nr:glycoside hydrolase family 5 protein [Acidicapsa acidisoli]
MRRLVFPAILSLFLAVTSGLGAQSRFVHADGKFLADAHGHKLILRGTNLGNWLVQEGYMFRLEHGPQSAREIEAIVNELIGPTDAAKFWHEYRDQYITRKDIDLIAKAGFNTIRIPFHYKFFEPGNEEGFALVDRVVGWAKEDGLYVILDMHCAPGGQTGANIDDSWGYPWLYEDEASQQHAMDIWKRVAEHYRSNPTVLGYDLLNEPIPTFPNLKQYNSKLEPVYKKLVAAVRSVDQNHVVILGGAQWDTNFTVFGPPFDKNMMYTFHKYWMKPEQKEIQSYVDFRDKYNVPIWMGESGENTDEWISQFRKLLDDNEISWTFWPYKKMQATSAPVTFARPEHWDEIVAFAAQHFGMGDTEKAIAVRPSLDDSRAAFQDLLVKIRFENSTVNESYLNALVSNTK